MPDNRPADAAPARAFRAAPRRIRLLVAAGALALLLTGAQQVAAQYTLQPGDTVRLSVAGLPMSEVQAEVDIDGNLPLAWFGTFRAEGRTIEQLTADVRKLADGQVIKRYTNEGDLNLIKPRAEDIHLQVTAYQPIVVMGDVARAGEFPYRPGLTVRGAIGVAGGARDALLAGIQNQDPLNVLRWQNDRNIAILDHAVASLRLWRLTAELNEDYDSPPPTAPALGIAPEAYEALEAEQRRLLNISRQALAEQRQFLQRSLDQTVNRVRILRQQQVNMREALASDEQEEARVSELLKSGLAMAGRAAEARRASVMTATRLLEIEDAYARNELEVTRMERQIREFEETRNTQRLEARELARRELLAATLRREGAERLNTGARSMHLPYTENPGIEPLAVVHRRTETGTERLHLSLDDAVMPGDTIEVTLPSTGGAFGAVTQ